MLLFLFSFNCKLALIGIICAYGNAWVGHFVFEKNRPATFKYPFYSLICDFIMYYKFLTGEISLEFKKYSLKNQIVIPINIF